MDTNKRGMETMHKMCQKELQQLQLNLSNFLQESERMQRILNGRKAARKDGIFADGDGTGNHNMFALIAFDRYMSQVGIVINMARKFNIHFQLNKLKNTVVNPAANGSLEGESVVQTRILQDYIKWSNTRIEQDMGNELIGEDVCVNGAIGLEITESLTWKKNNLQISPESQAEVMYKRNKNVQKQSMDTTMRMLEDFLKIILPTKNLKHFKEGHEFSGSITYVHEYKNLVFFISELNDYGILYEFSNPQNLTRIQRSSLSDVVFCVSENKRQTTVEKECVCRAVMVPEEGKDAKDSVYLIDFGEVIPLTDECELYKAPLKYFKTPPLAIKCILKGVQSSQSFITRDHEKCEQILRSNIYQMVQFRVVQQENGVLHVILLEKPLNKIYEEPCKENETNSKILKHKNSNPFLDTTLLFDDDLENSNDNIDILPLPKSVVYNTSCTPPMSTLNLTAQSGDQLQILVTHVISPITFYAIIQNASTDQSKPFSWADYEIATLQKQITPPHINDIVLSQYIKDEYWYRAKVIDIIAERDLYKVFYVDFGNTEIVPLSCLAKCTKQQLEDPLRAVLFRLENLSITTVNAEDDAITTVPAIDDRLQKAIETLVVLILDQTLNVEVVKRHKNYLVVRLTDQQYLDIPEMLIDMGVVVKEV